MVIRVSDTDVEPIWRVLERITLRTSDAFVSEFSNKHWLLKPIEVCI